MKLSASLLLLSSLTVASAFAPSSFGVARSSSALFGAVTPKEIKALRDATGAGMMDCKKALLETDGDMEAASEFLRKSGLVKADKKATRIAAEGKIAVAKNEDGKCVLVEINCETDFVAKDENFAAFSEEVATAAVGISADDNDMDALMAASVGDKSMEDYRQAMVAKIGENIQVRRFASMGGSGTTVGSYIHMNKIGVLVELEGGTEELAVDVAMHVAAMNPQFATADDVDEATLEKERRILTEQALESGKPKEIVDKMVEGRVRKYLEEICLVSQTFVKTNDKTVGQMLKDNGATMKGFKRIAVGEGIEKKQEDFAAEVAKAAGKA
jgi:elongation factor Ts